MMWAPFGWGYFPNIWKLAGHTKSRSSKSSDFSEQFLLKTRSQSVIGYENT
jgi:hypothetical protein